MVSQKRLELAAYSGGLAMGSPGVSLAAIIPDHPE